MVVNSYYFELPAPDKWAEEYGPLKWAKKHCKSYITIYAVQKKGQYYYRFYFGNEKDYMWFKLRWS